MDPSKNPRNNKETNRGQADDLLGEMIDEVLLDEDDRRDGFELDELLGNPTSPTSRTLDMRQYDERDYQSHRRESYTHHSLRHQHSTPSSSHSSQRRKTSSTRTEANVSTLGGLELEALVTSPLVTPVVGLDYHDLTESPPKKVQFEIGGVSETNEDQAPQDRKKHRKHHHHSSKYDDPSWRVRQGSETQHPQLVPYNSEFGPEVGSMDDLDQENLSTHRFSDNKGYRRHKYSSRFVEDPVAAMAYKPTKYHHKPHEIFVELDVLSGHGEHREWKEAARWIKYEEDVLEGSDRWGRPHVASLSFHSLINLRRLIESGVTLLDLEEKDLPGVAYRAVEAMVVQELIRPEDKPMVMRDLLLKHKHVNENEGMWRFNMRRNTTTSGSLTSLHAMLENERIRQHRSLGSPSTVPDGLVNTGGGADPKMARRNSAVSRLVNEHSPNDPHNHHDDHRIAIDEDSAFSPLHSQKPGDWAKMSLSNLSEEDMKWVMNKENLLRRIPVGAEASIVLVGKDDNLKRPIIAFIRLAESAFMPNITEVPIPVRFIYILLGPSNFDLDYKEIGRSISTLMSNSHFHDIAYRANDRRDMLKGIHDFLDESIVLPPGDWDNELFPFEEMKEKRQVLKKRKEKRRQSSISARRDLGLLDDNEGDEKPPEDHREKDHFVSLKRTKKIFGGMVNDVKHRYKLYLSDLRDGLNLQTMASIIFIYFACISGAIAFGGILGEKTEKHIGISETLIATAGAGLIFSIFSGQPLIILGTTGPLLLFDESLYTICKSNGINFLVFRFWIGIWVMLIGALVVAFDGSAIARFFTRFIQEIFASLISLLFIYDALVNVVKVYRKHPLQHSYGNSTEGEEMTPGAFPNTALLSTIMTFGTFYLAYSMRAVRLSGYFTLGIRKFLGNFAVPIAVVTMVCMDLALKQMTHTDKLKVPDGLTNTKPRDSWFVVGVSNIPIGMIFLAAIPAALVFILMFMETCICALIIGKKEMKLQKGGGYHLDIFLICMINGGTAAIGGCWVCAATVRAVAHASSLIVFSTNNPPGEKPTIVGVKEQRISSFIISIMIGVSVMMSPALKLIPMAVLFGVFLYMGISSMSGVQFFERCSLLFKQVANHPQLQYVHRVKTSKMHLFTIIQILCLVTLFGVKLTPGALAIPFLLILIVPLRLFVLKKIFKPSELQALDGTGEDEEEIDDPNKRPSLEKLGEGINGIDLDKEKQALMNYIDLDGENETSTPRVDRDNPSPQRANRNGRIFGHSPRLNLSPNSDNSDVFNVSPKSPSIFFNTGLENLYATSPIRQPEEKKRKSSMVTCNIIPPTPRRRSSLSSFISPHQLRPHGAAHLKHDSSNKENEQEGGKGVVSKRRRSSLTPYNLGPDSPSTNSSTPRRRSSLSSFLSPHQLHPHKHNSSNKENEEGEKGLGSKRRKSSLTTYDLEPDFPSLVEKFCHSELQLDIQDLLGRGSFGTVLGAIYKGKAVAVKILRHMKGEQALESEKNALELPPHPHVVGVFDVLRISQDRALVILERMEKGNLLSLINDPDISLPLGTVVDISAQVACALSFCHSHGLLHLDVKPQNILIHSTGSVKLCDFGNSKRIKDLKKESSFTKLDGTVGFKAPELFKGEMPTEMSDVYSLGITMWQLMSREQPYLGETEHSVIYKVVAQGLRPKSVCYFHSTGRQGPCEKLYVQFYEKAWNGDPHLRQSMSQLYKQLRQLKKKL